MSVTLQDRQQMLCIEDLTVSYHRVPAIHHLSLSMGSGSDRKSLFVGGRWEAGRSGESA